MAGIERGTLAMLVWGRNLAQSPEVRFEDPSRTRLDLTAAKRSKGYQPLNETARPADSAWAGIRF
jgi:hypothetical protein